MWRFGSSSSVFDLVSGESFSEEKMELVGRRAHAIWMCVCVTLIAAAHSFYLPGVAPQDFVKGDLLKVKVNKLTSVKTQLPYSYYTIPYCKPEKIVDNAENLGEVLRGDRLVYSGRNR